MPNLQDPIYKCEKKARRHLEKLRWPDGVVCPHCNFKGDHRLLKGKSTRPGLYKCRNVRCLRHFTVTVGTAFERSHVPLTKWLLAAHLMGSSKKGMSASQLHRMLGVRYKTAWFMAHRLREAMIPVGKEASEIVGGEGKIVEVDETYIGNKRKKAPGARGWAHKEKVLSIVERKGKVRSFHVPACDAATLRPYLHARIDRASLLMTDDARQYIPLGKEFAQHESVNHSAWQYAREGGWNTNTIEGFFSIFKRGMKGVYQHCRPRHLQRYLYEFDFRYNHREALGINDEMRIAVMLKGIEGKRLTAAKLSQSCK